MMRNVHSRAIGKLVGQPMAKATRQQGITLIELMIVIGIIGILVAIAAPSYSQYVRTARRAEAQQELLKAAAELEKLYGRRGSYTGALFTDDISGLSSTQFRVGPLISRDENGTDGDYAMSFSDLTASTFRITAAPIVGGPQEADTQCNSMSYNQAGQKFANGLVDINGDCW